MSFDSGGQVHPRVGSSTHMRQGCEGMSYRNLVAVEAMREYMAMFAPFPHVVGTPAFMDSIARCAFQMADRMVRQSRASS